MAGRIVTDLPDVYRAHLDAVTGGRTLADIWEPDGVLEFPYAPGGSARLVGVPAMDDYFAGLTGWTNWRFRDEVVRRVGDEYVVEIHGSADKGSADKGSADKGSADKGRADEGGGTYEQDYIVRFGVSPAGRIAWMREFWDPTRLS